MNKSESSYSEETLPPEEVLARKINAAVDKMHTFFENVEIKPSPEDANLINYFVGKIDEIDPYKARQVGTLGEKIGGNEEWLISLNNADDVRIPPVISFRNKDKGIERDFQLNLDGSLTVNIFGNDPDIEVKSVSKVIELINER